MRIIIIIIFEIPEYFIIHIKHIKFEQHSLRIAWSGYRLDDIDDRAGHGQIGIALTTFDTSKRFKLLCKCISSLSIKFRTPSVMLFVACRFVQF